MIIVLLVSTIHCLKVSRSQNKIVELQLLPKNKWTNFFFYPGSPEITSDSKNLVKLQYCITTVVSPGFFLSKMLLETWNSISSLKYFQIVRVEKQICSFIFGRSFGMTILFWDLRTFSRSDFDQLAKIVFLVEYPSWNSNHEWSLMPRPKPRQQHSHTRCVRAPSGLVLNCVMKWVACTLLGARERRCQFAPKKIIRIAWASRCKMRKRLR